MTPDLSSVDVRSATHVKDKQGRIERIASTWGIDAEGRLDKASKGGFGVVTESGACISMWDACRYYDERSAGSRAALRALGVPVGPIEHETKPREYRAWLRGQDGTPPPAAGVGEGEMKMLGQSVEDCGHGVIRGRARAGDGSPGATAVVCCAATCEGSDAEALAAHMLKAIDAFYDEMGYRQSAMA